MNLPRCAIRASSLAFLLLSVKLTVGADLYVSPAGLDSHPGTSTAPVRTLAAARDLARKMAGESPVTVHVADGVHYLAETLVLTAADSGTEDHPVVYRAENEGQAIISGGIKLDLVWERHQDGVFKATTPQGISCDQLFINGMCQRMARYPNFDSDKSAEPYQGWAADAVSKDRAGGWADPAGGYIHAMHKHTWGGYHYLITGKDERGELIFEGGWQNNRQLGMHDQFRMVENVLEELDAPGEWYHDSKTNLLFCYPPAELDLATATIEAVRLRHLIEFRGSASDPVRYVTLQGFTLRHAARTFMDTKEPLLRSDWTIYRGGALLLTGTEHVRILDCDFDQLGGNAVFVSRYNRHALIKGCHLHDMGASGVCFVGDPTAVRNPLFEYGQNQDLSQIDRTPGPKTEDYPADCAVEDCLIHGVGRVERQPAGVQISMARRITVRDTSIYDCVRAGINIGDGCWGGHHINGCDVFDTVLETGDHGSFNSWGRDRYWNGNHRAVSEPAVNQDPELPFLDAVEPVVIRNSRWRCDHGWDIDLDDGSSNYQIYNNLLLHGGLKFREGFGRKAWNNVLVNCGFHPHVWFADSASEFRQNIVMAPHAPIGMPAGWGSTVDENLFSSEAFLHQHDSDAHSVSGDPLFVDPPHGNFRVTDSSPALTIGFTNFPMDRFGVRKTSLKAIARSPQLPDVQTRVHTDSSRPSAVRRYWLGALLHGLQGEEFSAFGVGKEDLGVQLVHVPPDSPAAQVGLRKDDVVQGVNGHRVADTAALITAAMTAGPRPIPVRLVRSQQLVELTLTAVPYVQTTVLADTDALAAIVRKQGTAGIVTCRPAPRNNPLAVLTDGALATDYGPVFANGERQGIYRMDLGSARSITSISSWSYSQNGNRGQQRFTLYGSPSDSDPGWNTSDADRFTPLSSLDTRSPETARFVVTSLRAPAGRTLGRFRWIIWETLPVTDLDENTAWQEFQVESSDVATENSPD